jgi:hypothetical protein
MSNYEKIKKLASGKKYGWMENAIKRRLAKVPKEVKDEVIKDFNFREKVLETIINNGGRLRNVNSVTVNISYKNGSEYVITIKELG